MNVRVKLKAIDEIQDKNFISEPDRLILERSGLGFYNYLSYDPKHKVIKIIEAIKAGKKKLNMNYVITKLKTISEEETDFAVKSLIKELLHLNLRCFWVEVSKEFSVHSKYDGDCRRVINLGIKNFEAHHAYKEKNEVDKPYDDTRGLYKRITKAPNMVYMYYSEDHLVSEIVKRIKETVKDPKSFRLGMFNLEQLKEISEN